MKAQVSTFALVFLAVSLSACGYNNNKTASTTSAATVAMQPATNPSGSPTPTAVVNYSMVNAQIFTPYCISCHSGSSASAGIDLSSYAGVVAEISAVEQEAITRQAMPPSGALSSANQALLQEWINAGEPQ